MNALFENISEEHKTEAVNGLLKDSVAKPSFYFLMILSVLMATFGLILNNNVVVIGSMLIAPLLSPLLSLALGITVSEKSLTLQSIQTITKSLMYSVLVAMLATLLMWHITGDLVFQEFYNTEILSRTEPSFTYFLIAVIAGIATAYARVKPELHVALPGTAIAVSLVPPLAVVGIGIGTLNIAITFGALSMFLINVVGIIFASILMFSLMRMYTRRKVVDKIFHELNDEPSESTEE